MLSAYLRRESEAALGQVEQELGVVFPRIGWTGGEAVGQIILANPQLLAQPPKQWLIEKQYSHQC